MLANTNIFSKTLFLVTILVVSINVESAYLPKNVTVQPLYPKGLRMFIPHEDGISLVAFHVKFNEEFDGLEAGTIARDIIKTRDNRWTYQDRTTQLKKGDKIYYWINTIYNGQGFNLLDQEYTVNEFYNYNGEPVGNVIDQNCATQSQTRVISNNAEQTVCSGQTIFEEKFDNLNANVWTTVERFSGPPDYEFVVYKNSNENVNVKDGRLYIIPQLLENKYSEDFVLHNTLNLASCTGRVGSYECQQEARGASILPPVISGRINTKNSFSFLYGRVEIRAKVPRGDWIYPLLTLEHTDIANKGQVYNEIRVATVCGNPELRSPTGANLGAQILSAGGVTITDLRPGRSPIGNRLNLPRKHSSTHWFNDFHTYEIEWRSDRIIMKVDGEQYGEQAIGGEFNRPLYLNLGLAVGGYGEFPDFSTSTGYEKPWRNVAAKALLDFFNAREHWLNTWMGDATNLQVDYVKVTAL